MNPITIAMGLAQFAPSIIKWITGSDKAEAAANHVVAIAQGMAGTATGPEALEAMKANLDLQIKFREHLADQEQALDLAYLADTQSARQRDVDICKAGQRNWRAETMYALSVAVILWLVFIVWKHADLPEYAKGIFTLVLGRFLGYLDGIYNFEFGTTRASRTKDATIENLTK